MINETYYYSEDASAFGYDEDGELFEFQAEVYAGRQSAPLLNFDGMLLVAVGLVAFMLFNILRDRVQTAMKLPQSQASVALASAPVASTNQSGAGAALPQVMEAAAPAGVGSYVVQSTASLAMFTSEEMELVAAPYSQYTLTQGVHGASYGHAAIDLSAGKGEPVTLPD